MNKTLDKKLTILVNSCDAYSDLWEPFFILFDKFGGELKNCPIILNADNKKYKYKGLNITCPNQFENNVQWGKRVKNCLKHVKTDHVLTLLDDFFIQRPCNVDVIKQCIDWLDGNKNVGAFNLLSMKQSEEESEKFKNFCFIKPETGYRLNSQACIWRKEILDKSMLDDESPWDWELFGNLRNSVILKDVDFYCISEKVDEPYFYNAEFCNKKYSPDKVQNAVIRGKWDLNCVEKCFKENGIEVDYSKRGIYVNEEKVNIFKKLFRKINKLFHLKKTLSNRKNFKVCAENKKENLVNKPIEDYKKNNGK